MPKLLNDDITRQVQELFEQLKEPVEVLFFGQKEDCLYCADTLQLVREVTELSEKLSLSSYDLVEQAELARQYGVDKAPTLVFAAKDGEKLRDYGMRFTGIPSGSEFSTLIHDLMLVSGRDSGLKQNTRQALQGLKEQILLQVFVTPT
jgi:glutaredoxin-like protein